MLLDRKDIIKIDVGEYFRNRTRIYLAPSLKFYNNEFITKLSSLYTLAVGVQDFGYNINKEDRIFTDCIYMLVDTKGASKYKKYINEKESRVNFSYTLEWLRQHESYITDYPFDSGRFGHQHMIVLKLPFENMLEKFMKGHYSNIYTAEQVEKFIPKFIVDPETKEQVYNPSYGVLSKDPEYLPHYCEQLNALFSSNLTVSDIEHHTQFDVPPMIRNEVFRFNQITTPTNEFTNLHSISN